MHRHFLGREGEIGEEGRETRVIFESQQDPRHLDQRTHPAIAGAKPFDSQARVHAQLKRA